MTRSTLRLLLFSTAAVAVSGSPAIRVTEITDHGQPSYRIETPSATWVYHREGAGFSSLIDPDGIDWIAYRPGGGAAGNFRGIPNAVFRRGQMGNNFFHPGHAGAKGSDTVLVAAETLRVVLRSTSDDGRWTCEWEILPDRARFRMTRLPIEDQGYWFLYEGTPGGRFEPTDLVVRPGGAVTPLSETWEASTREVPWVAFASLTRGHALVIAVHDPPETRVSYRPMQDAMTVLGFGRKHGRLENLLTQPMEFTVALIKETAPAKIAGAVDALKRQGLGAHP